MTHERDDSVRLPHLLRLPYPHKCTQTDTSGYVVTRRLATLSSSPIRGLRHVLHLRFRSQLGVGSGNSPKAMLNEVHLGIAAST